MAILTDCTLLYAAKAQSQERERDGALHFPTFGDVRGHYIGESQPPSWSRIILYEVVSTPCMVQDVMLPSWIGESGKAWEARPLDAKGHWKCFSISQYLLGCVMGSPFSLPILVRPRPFCQMPQFASGTLLLEACCLAGDRETPTRILRRRDPEPRCWNPPASGL